MSSTVLSLNDNDLAEINLLVGEIRHKDAMILIQWINRKIAAQRTVASEGEAKLAVSSQKNGHAAVGQN